MTKNMLSFLEQSKQWLAAFLIYTNISHYFINMNFIWFCINVMGLFLATGRSCWTADFLIQAETLELLRKAY